MPRYTTPPLTEQALWSEGPPIRLRDVVAITGWSGDTIIRAVDAGTLQSIRLTHRPKAPYYFARHELRRWLASVGWTRQSA